MNNVRLFFECEELSPILPFEATDAEVCKILQDRFAKRVADAIADVLQEDNDVRWHNKEFTMQVSFYTRLIPAVSSYEPTRWDKWKERLRSWMLGR